MINRLLQQLKNKQKENGCFETYQRNIFHPQKGWQPVQDSPFFTANILLAIQEVDDPIVKEIQEQGFRFLRSTMEVNGLWRFWHHTSSHLSVPFDADDTSVCSQALLANNMILNNKYLLLANKDKKGYLINWFFPRKEFLLMQNYFWKFLWDVFRCSKAIISKKITYTEKDTAVAANILLYLGESEVTKEYIQMVIKEILEDNIVLHYYEDRIILYYHISRAYAAGVVSFNKVRNTIHQHLINQEKKGFNNILLSSTALTILIHFGLDSSLQKRIYESIKTGFERNKECGHNEYFITKDRYFWFGSDALTTALVLEALHCYQKENHIK